MMRFHIMAWRNFLVTSLNILFYIYFLRFHFLRALLGLPQNWESTEISHMPLLPSMMTSVMHLPPKWYVFFHDEAILTYQSPKVYSLLLELIFGVVHSMGLNESIWTYRYIDTIKNCKMLNIIKWESPPPQFYRESIQSFININLSHNYLWTCTSLFIIFLGIFIIILQLL